MSLNLCKFLLKLKSYITLTKKYLQSLPKKTEVREVVQNGREHGKFNMGIVYLLKQSTGVRFILSINEALGSPASITRLNG